MRHFIHEYCERYKKQINPDIFNRTFDRPLVDYILDTCKNIEVVPGITLESWEFITDQTKIHTNVNKKLSKNPKIKNNKRLERLVTPNATLYDLLVLYFKVEVKGKVEYVTRRLRIPKPLKKNFYIKGGKLVVPLIQIVDNSTFVKGSTLHYKTTLYPIKFGTQKVKLPFTDGTTISADKMQIDLFKKLTTPLCYIIARYGLQGTIELFRLESVVSVVDRELDTDKYLYIKINNDLFIEVNKNALPTHEFIVKFVCTLNNLMSEHKKATLKEVYDKDYWVRRLAEVFSSKQTLSKGLRVLTSFMKITDPYTKRRLKVPPRDKTNTFRILRWMMVHATELLSKDSNDLKHKRMRVNEIQAYYFDSYITRNVYSLLNTDNPSMEKYLRLLNAINEFTLLRSSTGGKGSRDGKNTSSTLMFRYERFNDFDAINLVRYTLKGPTGLNGDKKKISKQYRDIYESHIGRYDIYVCTSDPGLAGYLTANVQFDEDGHFDANADEVAVYDKEIVKALEGVAEPGYEEERRLYIETQLMRDDEGFIVLERRMSREELNLAIAANPWDYGLYWHGDELRFIPNMGEPDANGFFRLQRIRETNSRRKSDAVKRDSEGFMILEPTENILSKKSQLTVGKKKKKK